MLKEINHENGIQQPGLEIISARRMSAHSMKRTYFPGLIDIVNVLPTAKSHGRLCALWYILVFAEKRFPMRETEHEYVTPGALHQLQKALDRIAKAKSSDHDPLTCSVCHKPITLETKGICADEYGKVAHADCYVQQVIAAKRPPTPDHP
jgi:hypothetical protein